MSAGLQALRRSSRLGEGRSRRGRAASTATDRRCGPRRPAPPGARLEATLDRRARETPVKIKSHGTRKRGADDGHFTLKGRLIDATRELRERLAGARRARGDRARAA